MNATDSAKNIAGNLYLFADETVQSQGDAFQIL